MAKLELVRGNDMLFRVIKVKIDSTFYSLKRGMKIEVELAGGFHDIMVQLDCASSHKNINLEDKKDVSILIKRTIPDLYYILGILILMILCTLSFFNIISIVIPSICLIVYFIPLFLDFLINRKRFFRFINCSGID
jgi:hypothetical protein